ncbi:DUF3810 domain-containing protein [Polaribacter pacificus]|nr:DUF3810 domain-containing protein [Polaribacter pacificus]
MKRKKTLLILTLLLPVQIVLVQWFSKYPQHIEQVYSNGMYPHISRFLRVLFGWMPFSMGDVLIFGLILFLFYKLLQIIGSKFKKTLIKTLQITALFSVLYGCFYLFWGFNYFREPLAKNLNIKNAQYTTRQLLDLNEKLVLLLNETHSKLTSNDSLLVNNAYTTQDLYHQATVGYDFLAKTYPQFAYSTPSVKSSLMSLAQTYNSTLGYLNPITGEAQINNRIPKTSIPATTCHEMAHQIGWAAENEANFVGFLAATSNPDLFFQYSGYRMAFSYAFAELRKRNAALASIVWEKVHLGIVKDYQETSKFWQAYQNPIEPYIKKGYNSYLKANKQANGIDSYDYVVDLLIGYYAIEAPKDS